MIRTRLRNVVGGGSAGCPLPLDAIAKWDGAAYNPLLFPGLRLRLGECTVQLFATGKIVVVGATSEDEVYGALERVLGMLRDAGIGANCTDRKIYNIVATADLGNGLDTGLVARSVPKSLYEPEHFPGVIIRRTRPKCTILLFASGSVVCVGAESAGDAEAAVNQMGMDLRESGLL